MQKRRINIWKWLFFVLIISEFLLATLIWVKITSPQSKSDNNTMINANFYKKLTKINVSLNKRQLDYILNYYLNENTKGKDIKYNLSAGKTTNFKITQKILNKKITLTALANPKINKQGNLQLKLKTLKIGNLKIPQNLAMYYIKNKYELSKKIVLKPTHSLILINLNQLLPKNNFNKIKTKNLKISKGIYHFSFNFAKTNKK